MRSAPAPVELAPDPPRPNRLAGCLGTATGLALAAGAAWAATVPGAWDTFQRWAKVAAAVGAAGAGLAGLVWLARAWRAASRWTRAAALGLLLLATIAVVWVFGGLWGKVTLSVLLAGGGGVFLAPRLRRVETTDSDNSGQVRTWSQRTEDNWTGDAHAAGLTGPGPDGPVAPLLEPPTEPAPGVLELVIGLDEAGLLPEDVRHAGEQLRRRLRASHVRVRPEQVVDAARVRVYRRHPIDIPCTWRDLEPLQDPTGEWAPVGLDEWDDLAMVRWRQAWLITGAQDSGKTALVRAAMAGLAVQRVPVRWWIWDNRADYRQLKPIAYRYAAGWTDALDMLRDLDNELSNTVQSSPDLDTGFERTPRLSSPADVLIVGELLTALAGPGGKSNGAVQVEVSRLLRRRAVDGRAMAHGMWATVQVSTKDDVGPIRDLFPQRACCRVESESLVDPALGSGALDAGAEPHRIPPALRGGTVLIDPVTKEPYYARSAWVPPHQVGEAIVAPYKALMGRRLTVIDGDTA